MAEMTYQVYAEDFNDGVLFMIHSVSLCFYKKEALEIGRQYRKHHEGVKTVIKPYGEVENAE